MKIQLQHLQRVSLLTATLMAALGSAIFGGQYAQGRGGATFDHADLQYSANLHVHYGCNVGFVDADVALAFVGNSDTAVTANDLATGISGNFSVTVSNPTVAPYQDNTVNGQTLNNASRTVQVEAIATRGGQTPDTVFVSAHYTATQQPALPTLTVNYHSALDNQDHTDTCLGDDLHQYLVGDPDFTGIELAFNSQAQQSSPAMQADLSAGVGAHVWTLAQSINQSDAGATGNTIQGSTQYTLTFSGGTGATPTPSPSPNALDKHLFLPIVFGPICPTNTLPLGLQQMVAPTGKGVVGLHISLAMGECGIPSVAFVTDDPNGDGNHADSILSVATWGNGAQVWDSNVVDTVGDINHNYPNRQVWAAFDRATGVWAMVYQKAAVPASAGDAVYEIWFAYKAAGAATWLTSRITQSGRDHNAGSPTMTIHNNQVHVVYREDVLGWRHASLTLGAGPSHVWAFETIPAPAGTTEAIGAPAAALDDNFVPGFSLLYHGGNLDYVHTAVFWRPNLSNTVVAMDSSGYASSGGDDDTTALTFDGLNPRIATVMIRAEGQFYDRLQLAVSNDGGQTWNDQHVADPNTPAIYEANRFVALAAPSRRQLVIGATTNGNPSPQGRPTLVRSTDLQHWAWTGAAAQESLSGHISGNYINVQAYEGKIFAVAQGNLDGNATGDDGVVIYREP